MQQVTEAPAHTGTIFGMDKTGDSKVHWDKNKPAEVAAARATFDILKEKGYAAFKLNSSGEKGEQIREFDPNAEKILMAPPLAGG